MARKPISKRVRFTVFARNNFMCVYCGRQPPTVTLEIEHVVPVCQGGGDEETNLKTSCHECNAGKGGKSIGQIVPTETERLKQAQELSEKRRQLDELAACQKASDDLRQNIVIRWCLLTGSRDCPKSSVTCIANLIHEFGAALVVEWMELSTERTFREKNAIRYLCGIARRVREEQK